MKKIHSLIFMALIAILPLTSFAQYNQIMIGDNNNGQILTSDLSGANLDTLAIGAYFSFYDADVDPLNQKIYLAWYYGIYRMNYDGTGLDTIINDPMGGYSSGIAVDPINEYVYWGSTQGHSIIRANLDGSGQTAIISGAGYMGDVDIDLKNNKLYFCQYIFSSNYGVYRADLNGTNIDTVASGYDADYIGLDEKNEYIYFSNNVSTRRINYDKTGDTLIFNFQVGGYFCDTTSGLLYTSSITDDNIFVSNPDGSSATNLFAPGNMEAPYGPLLFNFLFTSTPTLPDYSSGMQLFPNPACSGQITLCLAVENSELSIYNMVGEIMFAKSMNSKINQIDISSLPTGVYLLKVQGDSYFASRKLVVR